MIVLGIACGELLFIAGIMLYEKNSIIYSSILRLFLSIVGYVPGRIITVYIAGSMKRKSLSCVHRNCYMQ